MHPTCSQTKTDAHRHHTCCIPWTKPSTVKLDRSNPSITQLIMWKVHVAHDCEHNYHVSLHSTKVAQLYPQVGDFIASQVTKKSPFCQMYISFGTRPGDHHIVFSPCFSARKIFTLRFHHYGSRILQRPPLMPRLGDKHTPSPKSRKSHHFFLPQIFAKLGKQHVT
jgi:hypothetical protein